MINRDWQCYMAKHHFAEGPGTEWPEIAPAEVAEYNASLLPGFEAQILRLPSPIISKCAEVAAIADVTYRGKRLRLYPPSPIDRRGEVTGAFQLAWIPQGLKVVERYVRIDDSAVSGLVASVQPIQECQYCEALRVDAETGAHTYEFVNRLLENIGQYTHQWWLRGRTNPFRGMRQFGSELNKDFSLRTLLRYAGAGKLESPWYGAHETQGLQGIEVPLTNAMWQRCIAETVNEQRGEPGFMSFHDAICYYMAQDDDFAVLSMCLAFEILGNKHRLIEGKKAVEFNELLRSSPLVSEEHKQTFRNLFIDRGHVAHGRRPHVLGKQKGVTVEQYMIATADLVQRFLSALPAGAWPHVSQLDIGRKGGASK